MGGGFHHLVCQPGGRDYDTVIPDEAPLAPRDHNQPPDLVRALGEAQVEALEPFIRRRNELVGAANAKTVFDRISAGDAADIIRIAGEVFKRIDEDRMERTTPYRKAADLAKGIADGFWIPVDEAVTALRGRLKAWTDAEDDRIAAQQREQNEAMAQMRRAAEPIGPGDSGGGEGACSPNPPPRSAPQPAFRRKIRGDLGATVSTVERAEFRVADVRLVPDWIMASPTVHAAIIQVVKSMARHIGEIPGIETSTSSDNQIR